MMVKQIELFIALSAKSHCPLESPESGHYPLDKDSVDQLVAAEQLIFPGLRLLRAQQRGQ